MKHKNHIIMRLSKLFFLSIFVLFSFNACKTDEPKPILYDSYLPMAVGNYWIYQNFAIKTDGTEVPLNSFDSIFIKSDTIINGQRYFAFFYRLSKNIIYQGGGITTIPHYLRDSAGYIVEPANKNYKKFLSTTNFKDTLSVDTFYLDDYFKKTPFAVTKSKMERDIIHTQVPNGSFDAIIRNEHCNWYIYKEEYNPKTLDNYVQTAQPMLFAKNVGLIKRTYYYYQNDVKNGAGTKNEIRLIRYRVKEE